MSAFRPTLVFGLCVLTAGCVERTAPSHCGEPATRIGEIQGSGPASPLAQQQVTIEGVVTATFPGAAGLGGFILQDIEPDQDIATSDGIFIAAPDAAVAVGDRLRLAGTVVEMDGTTSLASIAAPERCGTAVAQPRNLAVGATRDLEAFEAMLVLVEEPLAFTDLYDLGRRGRFIAATGGRQWAPTHDGPAAAAQQRRLAVDDGSVVEPAPAMPLLEDGRPPRVGDRVAGLVGVVLEDQDGFVLHRTSLAGVEVRNPRPAVPPAVAGELRIAAFNVLNFFTTLGSRGAGSADELERQQAKIVAALAAIDADLVALLEIENGGPALGRLLTALETAGAGPYRAAGDATGRVGSDDIRVALIYRPATLEARGPVRVLDDPVFRGRPMLAQTFRGPGGETFTAVAAHWKSKGGCDRAEGADRDQGDGQGCWNDLRVREARRTGALVADLERSTGDPDVLLIGDLNAHGAEDPIAALRRAGLVDLVARFVTDPAERYSFVFRGLAGRLDHAFATPALARKVSGTAYWHINADESRALDYSSDNPPALYRPDPFRSSDHDPLLVGVDW